MVDLPKHLIKPGFYFVSIPNGWPCMINETLSHKFQPYSCDGQMAHALGVKVGLCFLYVTMNFVWPVVFTELNSC